MPVKLSPNGRPVAFADDERLEGEDIPMPPTPPAHYRWDGSQWVEDPPTETDPSTLSDAELAAALREGDEPAAEVLAHLLESRRIPGGGGN